MLTAASPLVRYAGLKCLTEISQIQPILVLQNQTIILEFLQHNDDTFTLAAITLLHRIINEVNLHSIAEATLNYCSKPRVTVMVRGGILLSFLHSAAGKSASINVLTKWSFDALRTSPINSELIQEDTSSHDGIIEFLLANLMKEFARDEDRQFAVELSSTLLNDSHCQSLHVIKVRIHTNIYYYYVFIYIYKDIYTL